MFDVYTLHVVITNVCKNKRTIKLMLIHVYKIFSWRDTSFSCAHHLLVSYQWFYVLTNNINQFVKRFLLLHTYYTLHFYSTDARNDSDSVSYNNYVLCDQK